MKTGDMERFNNVFEEEPVLRRALESMDSYKYFPGFYLRYTDKDTLFYKMDDYGKFQYPGMAVRILPLQCAIWSQEKISLEPYTGRWMEKNPRKKRKVEKSESFCLCLYGTSAYTLWKRMAR